MHPLKMLPKNGLPMIFIIVATFEPATNRPLVEQAADWAADHL
ncbi:MAG: hypothetical protein QOK02_2710 [Mycobacterium sp.]|nr:hypothetical protein [Mycobacterium sp.]